jgi:hypothetical protein
MNADQAALKSTDEFIDYREDRHRNDFSIGQAAGRCIRAVWKG